MRIWLPVQEFASQSAAYALGLQEARTWIDNTAFQSTIVGEAEDCLTPVEKTVQYKQFDITVNVELESFPRLDIE